MNNPLPDKDQKSLAYLCDDIDTILLWQVLMRPNDLREISITKLLDDIVIFATSHDVNKLYDIFAVNSSHDSDFVPKRHRHIRITINCI